ncbi:TonB-dependent receptor [Stakelama sp. CBK3Z-3]|uniref:TonB-dependent receptor n=1 Tax=Stakelama flava TaxID=2860338 RepID=A0ABS6XJX1_9SPHN|nr:TonB-dependent receptor [Stakelama flava]MBW4330482.1 TonB-dependent receptor [Stakelama flava]
MGFKTLLACGCTAITLIPASAYARQETKSAPTPATQVPQAETKDIVVTARQREESLQDVPISVTAVSGDMIKDQQLTTVKDVQAFTPGLNVNSDSAGRAFVSIRGIGTTLIDTVQPGVGIFIDGIYQPNTTYLNSPLVDVERVEVLRGPQGTLFGNNTLGGAINVITKKPGNDWKAQIDGAMASGDNYASVSANITGPIVRDKLAFRIGGAYHTQDGFQYNVLANGDQNPLETKSARATLLFTPSSAATITVNGSYDRVFGGATPYFVSDGPRDYSLDGQTNSLSLITIDYYAANIKGEFDVDALKTKITAIGAYNQSDADSHGDGDFSAIDFLRNVNQRHIKTRTGELRFDTQWNDAFSTLIGAYYNYSTNDQRTEQTLVPLNLTVPSVGHTTNKTYALFGTAFLSLGTLDISLGLRWDHQKLDAQTTTDLATYKADEVQPRLTITQHWTPDIMTYASVARGTRGGGQNEPDAPNLIYKGDSVWTYEIGTKATALDNRLQASIAIFYNDYKDFIGPNALAPSTSGTGFVAVNLNAGDAESYGLEGELNFAVTPQWRLYGNATLLHARVTDASEFQQTTGYAYPGDHIVFVPDLTYTLGTTYKQPIDNDQSLVFDANVVAKGERTGSSLDASSVPVLEAYRLVNASLSYRTKHFDIAVFATNLFDEKYMESYLDASLLGRAGVPDAIVNNLALQGNRRRVGLRGTVRF